MNLCGEGAVVDQSGKFWHCSLWPKHEPPCRFDQPCTDTLVHYPEKPPCGDCHHRWLHHCIFGCVGVEETTGQAFTGAQPGTAFPSCRCQCKGYRPAPVGTELRKSSRLWLLGADDPEMRAINTLLRACGESVAYAMGKDGKRVTAGNMYLASGPWPEVETEITYLVECGWSGAEVMPKAFGNVVQIDHHRPGDRGYGRPPAEFLSASSIGQVTAELARLNVRCPIWPSRHVGGVVGSFSHLAGDVLICAPSGTSTVPRALVLVAAADHCLGAAYRGECPGVGYDELLHHRTRQLATERARKEADRTPHDGLPRNSVVELLRHHGDAVRKDIANTREAILSAPGRLLGGEPMADMCREGEPWPELPEAACSMRFPDGRIGCGYIAGPLKTPDGRRKIVCSGSAAQVKQFMSEWAPGQKLTSIYGDPARGFAGGYLP